MPPKRKKLLKETKLAPSFEETITYCHDEEKKIKQENYHRRIKIVLHGRKIEDDIGVDTQMSEEIAGF